MQSLTRARRLVPTPASIRIVEDTLVEDTATYRGSAVATRLVLERRWYTAADAIPLALFCVLWDGILVSWYGGGFPGWDLFASFFPSLHVAAGVGITYQALCMILNRSRIMVAGGELSVTHGPLPWRAPRPMPTSEIQQLYCIQERRGKGRRVYSLRALSTSDQAIILVGGLPTPDLAHYLEATLEKRLGIADAPVAGEYL